MTSTGKVFGGPLWESKTTTDNIPELLKQICAEAEAFQSSSQERWQTASKWPKQVEQIQEDIPSVHIENNGETVYLGNLSPGCAACKAGLWDCILVTMRCNLDCDFCLRPRDMALPSMYTVLGEDLSTLCDRLRRAGISGISFSGGEPFLAPEQVLEWLSTLRKEFPRMYIWAYTNGLTLSTLLLEKLAEAGLNELRFNMAASGYEHRPVTKMLHQAVGHIPAVAVEIPAIPAHKDHVLKALNTWADAGVKYLNVHELIYEQGTNSEYMNGARAACVMPDGHPCTVHPASWKLISTLMKHVAMQDLHLSVNDCSLRSKARQMRGRRRMLAPFVLREHEQLRNDGLAESACLFSGNHIEFVHPDFLNKQRLLRDGAQAAIIRRQLPLDLKHSGQWVYFEIIE